MATSKSKADNKATDSGDAHEDFETVTVTREVLEETPARTLQLILAVNRSKPIRAAAERVGFSKAVRVEGWRKLNAVTGMDLSLDDEDEPAIDVDVATAITTLDATDEKLLAKIRATLQHTFPAEAKAVLKDLSAERGAASVLVVSTVLDRLDKLESTERGKAAIARLAERGLDVEARKRLLGLVRTASGDTGSDGAKGAKAASKKPEPEKASKKSEKSPAADDAEYLRKLRVLRAWFEEWSELLRTEISRRDYLIQLGLAERKSTKGKGGGAEEPT
ncbi:MAG: hypothetical protein JNK05_06480 [Myxococcales bacterium]|nr:hypothetical protein [Myxococcales bacterium]